VTSNEAAIRWLAPRRWRALHLIAYPIAVLSVIHEVMAYGPMKGEAGLYSGLGLLFLAARAARLVKERRIPAPRPLPVAKSLDFA